MNVVISGMAIVSSLGIGTEPFVAGWAELAGAGSAGAELARAGSAGAGPGISGADPGMVPGIDDDEDFAPTKQVRLKERSSALAVGTVAKLLAAHELGDLPAARRGIVLGSALASIDTFMAISRDSLAAAKPYFVDHKRVPACAMNYTSSQAAIRFNLRGPNVTVTAGRATGLTALTYGQRLIGAGRADAMLCGAFEEITPRRLRIEAAAGRQSRTAPPGEGCCVFLLEPAASAARGGRPVLAELLALTAGLLPDPDRSGAVLAGTATRALRRAGAGAGDVRLVVRGTPGGGYLAEREAAALAELVPGVPVVDPAVLVGDTYGASAAFGVAAAIVDRAGAGNRTGVTLVTSLDPDGQVACAVVR